MHHGPKLLVKWEPGWGSFTSAVRATLARYPGAQHIPTVRAGIPVRSPVASILLHFAVLFFWISLLPYMPPTFSGRTLIEVHQAIDAPDNVIYFRSGLPEVLDTGGAEAGRRGKSGGGEFYHPSQTIRIARGRKVVDTVVDAPTLHLARTERAVAALLAFSQPAPAIPAAAITSSERHVDLPRAAVVPPAPALAQKTSMMAIPLELPPVISPAPVAEHSISEPRLRLPFVEPVGPAPTEVTRDIRAIRNLGTETSVAAPLAPGADAGAASGGNTNSTGTTNNLIVSAKPGDQIGIPEGGLGSLAMSPTGRSRGIGGSGQGKGAGTGNDAGSAATGEGTGSGNSGTGVGSDPKARGGISLPAGPGGTGTSDVPSGLPGVSVSGGGTAKTGGVVISGAVVHLPSFGAATNAPGVPTKSPAAFSKGPGIVVIASARSGGALNTILAPKGGRVYTIYLDASWGSAVLQFSDPAAAEGFESDLIAPQPLRTDFPPDMKMSRTVVSCVMDRLGMLRNLRVVRSPQPGLTARLIEVLQRWKFRPVLRGDIPIEVNTVLGFGVDTE